MKRYNSTHVWVRTYEQEVARLLGVDHAIAFGYGRHALTGILAAAGLRAGDEIVLSPLTCKVVPLALLNLELKPVYADISPETLNLDPERVDAAIRPVTRAVLFQHTYGNLAGVDAVTKLAADKHIPVFEDCAQCLPYASDGRFPGTWGQAAIFSNNLRKPLPAGSGGVAITNDAGLAQRIQEIRDSLPQRSKFSMIMLRAETWLHKYVLQPALYWPLFNFYRKISPIYRVRSLDSEIATEITDKAYRVSGYQMCEGARWLRKLETVVAHRAHCCGEYTQALSDLKGVKILATGPSQPLYYFPVLVERKDDLLRRARRKGIELIAWPIRTPIYPIEDESKLLAYGYQPGSCPVAEGIARRLVGLPTDPAIGDQHRDSIVALLKSHHESACSE